MNMLHTKQWPSRIDIEPVIAAANHVKLIKTSDVAIGHSHIHCERRLTFTTLVLHRSN